MIRPTAADPRPARLRLWSNWLWLLAAILGAASLWSAARLIHDQKTRRDALRSIAQDKAAEIANLGATRFNLLVAGAFGPMWDNRFADARSDVAELDRVHTRAAECRCRDTLPVARFFRFDGSTTAPYAAESERLVQGVAYARDGIPDSTLIRIARTQFAAGAQSPASLQHVEIVGANAVVTLTRPARAGPGTKVYGAVMPVSGLAAALFGDIPLVVPAAGNPGNAPQVFAHGPLAEMHERHMAEHRRLLQLDTLGLGISADSFGVFGTVADRPYTAAATLPPPLERFHVNVGMMGSQVSLPLTLPFSYDRLWLNGHLVLATIVVCLFAIGASRREVALARARSDFVAGVSHDLRMPLAQILLAGETLSLGRHRNDAERSALLASILREGRRLKAMVDNVVLFSRAGAVGIEPHFQAVEVRSLLAAAAESVTLAAADAGQSIRIEVDDGAQVRTDRSLIHQALVNLLDNAMKYGAAGQTITLTGRRIGNEVEVAVADEGPGIPREARERLFEPYERLGRDTNSERTGSGLGLAVVRRIVTACGGSVRIDDVAKGARIVLALPAAP
jgi:signal transduction histidine kinase